ncbi:MULTISPECIES: hypothetical protein [unclassified Caballeronia]|uniref:hypothetical protein n=1 Tax=unclassified Caballeronia TaxID=2646786 RepID=UPI002029A757|nr:MULTISPECIES: hypothetical protein [unclassified Caballeronia]
MRDSLEHFRTAAREQREQEAHRHEQQVQQVQAELRQANQTAIVRQNEITQLNRDNARLVAEATATTRLARDQQAHGEALQSALNRALTERARAEAERDAAHSAADARAAELLQVREARDSLRADLTKLAAPARSTAAAHGGLPDAAGRRKPVDPAGLVELLDRLNGEKPNIFSIDDEVAAATKRAARPAANANANGCARAIRRGVELMGEQHHRLDAIRKTGADARDALILYESLAASVLTLVRLCGAIRDGRGTSR